MKTEVGLAKNEASWNINFKILFQLYFMCVLHLHICLHHLYAHCSQRPREGIKYGTEVAKWV